MTLAELLSSVGPGHDIVELEHHDFVDITEEIASYMQYTGAPTAAYLRRSDSLMLYAPHGVVRVFTKGGGVACGAESTPNLDAAANATANYYGVVRVGLHQACCYCGAHGQRIGSRCEYCARSR